MSKFNNHSNLKKYNIVFKEKSRLLNHRQEILNNLSFEIELLNCLRAEWMLCYSESLIKTTKFRYQKEVSNVQAS